MSFVAHRGAELSPFPIYDFDIGEVALVDTVLVVSWLLVDLWTRLIYENTSTVDGEKDCDIRLSFVAHFVAELLPFPIY